MISKLFLILKDLLFGEEGQPNDNERHVEALLKLFNSTCDISYKCITCGTVEVKKRVGQCLFELMESDNPNVQVGCF